MLTETLLEEIQKRFQHIISGTKQSIWCVMSDPPPGFHRVTNLYVEPSTGKLKIEFKKDK